MLSSLLQLDCKGVRSSIISAADASAGLHAIKLRVRVRVRVVKLRSSFYADAEHFIGSRLMQELVGDEATGQRATQQIKTYAERQVAADEKPQGSPVQPAVQPGQAARASFATSATPSAVHAWPAAPRFCSACGMPVLAGARFCQNCGATLG